MANKTVVRFALRNETPGAVRYQEVDAHGNPIKGDNKGALIDTLYLRKLGLSKIVGSPPQKFSIEITMN